MILSLLLLAATFTRPMERVSTLDPAMAQTVYDNRAVGLLYDPVLKVDYAARPYRLVPGVCELPEVSADGRVYTFRLTSESLAKGISAADVVRSLERLRDPDRLSPNAWVLKSVDTIAVIPSAPPPTAVGAIRITLHRPQPVFPWLMAMPCTSVMLPDGSGTGPYTLTSWWKNHEMVFTHKAPGTSHQAPSTVRYLTVEDPSTQWLMFLKGEVDMLGEIGRDNWDAVVMPDGRLNPALAARGITLHTMPTLEVLYLGVNMRDPVLGPNRKLRQALNCAFDFPAWQRFYQGRVLPCTSPVPPQLDGALTNGFDYSFNLDKARRLLAEAGYPDGIDPKTGRRLTLELSIGRATQDSRESGELLASFWAKVGIRLELRYYTWEAFMKAVNEGRCQLYRLGWVGDYPAAENFLQLFYSHSAAPGPNHGCYANPDFDAAFEKGDYVRCQEIVREDCPWIFTHVNTSNSLTHPRVGHYIPSDFPYGQEQYYDIR